MSCPCIQHCLRARNILLRKRQTLLFSSYNIFVFCCPMLHIFIVGYFCEVSLCLSSARLAIVSVHSPTFKGVFHCFLTLSFLYFSLSLSLKCHLAFLFLTSLFISTGLLVCCFDCSTNEILCVCVCACMCACVFGLQLCLSNRSVFSASP